MCSLETREVKVLVFVDNKMDGFGVASLPGVLLSGFLHCARGLTEQRPPKLEF